MSDVGADVAVLDVKFLLSAFKYFRVQLNFECISFVFRELTWRFNERFEEIDCQKLSMEKVGQRLKLKSNSRGAL
jgi:hypothetical protein